MKVMILDQDGSVIWERDLQRASGVASLGYLVDGTQKRIASALSEALAEAQGQLLSGFQIADVVTNVRPATGKINSDVPMIRVRHSDSRGQHSVEAPVVFKSAAASVALEIDVVRKHDIALMVAVNDDNVTGI